MVVFYLRNSLAPDDKIVPVTISLSLDPVLSTQRTIRPDQDPVASGTYFPNLLDSEGDAIWLLIVAPPREELDKDTGLPIPPEIINVVSESTVHDEIEAALGRIGSRVVWPSLFQDTQPPKLIEVEPALNATDVSIFSNIVYRLQEPLPAAGLDLSTLNIKLNNLPIVTSGVVVPTEVVEFKGNIFDFTILHRPKRSFS